MKGYTSDTPSPVEGLVGTWRKNMIDATHNKETPMIETLYTKTQDGRVPHLELVTQHGVVRCPVRILKPIPNQAPFPERDLNGRLIYALPGGGQRTA